MSEFEEQENKKLKTEATAENNKNMAEVEDNYDDDQEVAHFGDDQISKYQKLVWYREVVRRKLVELNKQQRNTKIWSFFAFFLLIILALYLLYIFTMAGNDFYKFSQKVGGFWNMMLLFFFLTLWSVMRFKTAKTKQLTTNYNLVRRKLYNKVLEDFCQCRSKPCSCREDFIKETEQKFKILLNDMDEANPS